MKINAFSDTHGFHDKCDDIIQPCDVLCIAGDFVPLYMQRNIPQSWAWFEKSFIPWLMNYPCKRVMLVGGNHDFFLDTTMSQSMMKKVLSDNYAATKIQYLCDSGVEYEGKLFWGCPYIENLSYWAFYTDTTRHYSAIPDCDVLITHSPISGPLGTVNQNSYNKGSDFGSQKLLDSLEGRKINLHFCGHVHSGQKGGIEYKGTQVYNVSMIDEMYQVAYPLTKVEL